MYTHNSYMVIVPHPDDEINIAGALIYELKLMKKEVKIVFVTNGNKFEYEGKIRKRESIKALKILGVKQEDIIFFEYPDGMIGELYKSSNKIKIKLENDIYEIIQKYRPQVLIVNDYDSHPDHKAVSLIFDSVMGKLLKQNKGYEPIILKKFAYNGVWEGEDDYYKRPFRKTLNNYEGNRLEIPYFQWKDRISYYVLNEAMTPYLKDNVIYRALSKYKIELAFVKAGSICSRDIVYWQRRSDNLCLRAEISASSGDYKYINDFKYIDCADLVNDKYNFSKYVWSPKDDIKMLEVKLEKKSYISQISIYENSSNIDNIMNVRIVFDDILIFNTGELNHNGSESRFVFKKKICASNLKVFIDSFQGENCGFTEFEVYEKLYNESNQVIKFKYRNHKIRNGNFIFVHFEKAYIWINYILIKIFRKIIRIVLSNEISV